MITQKELKLFLEYSSKNGEFRWKVSPRKRFVLSDKQIAGCISKAIGYCLIGINGKRYYAHRLAWPYMTGKWPTSQIDHVNGNKTDNRFCNLREADQSTNKCNKPKRKDNTSGYKGVWLHKETGKWRAGLKIRGRKVDLGLHATPLAAYAAYCKAANVHHGQYARV